MVKQNLLFLSPPRHIGVKWLKFKEIKLEKNQEYSLDCTPKSVEISVLKSKVIDDL